MDNKELIFSTKDNYDVSMVPWIAIVTIVFIVLMFIVPPLWVIICYLPVLISCNIATREYVKLKNSYVDVYNDAISGVSMSDGKFLNETTHFQLQYNEIIRLDYQPSKVRIYYNGGTYLVQAHGVEEKVISTIKKQIEACQYND